MKPVEEIALARSVFEGHKKDCVKCSTWDGSTGQLTRLCWRGTQFYKAILDAEEKSARGKSRRAS